jgi:hypothetical protein
MRQDEDQTDVEQSESANRTQASVIGWGCSVLFVLVTILPLIRRLRSPTILGDDVTRIVDLVKFPFREHLFLPFAEHIAPLFQLVSWVTWQLIGHDVRLAPLGYSAASVLSWALVLVLLGFWLQRETGSRTASLIAVALAAHSPLILETAWWYSASSFLWAIAGILVATLGATYLARRPFAALPMIGLGSALGLAGTTLGILAAPLAILRGLLEPRISRRLKVLVIVAAVGGVFTYRQVCKLGGVTVFHTDPRSAIPRIDLAAGLGYALSVPGRLLWPSLVGIPVSSLIRPLPAWFCIGTGAMALAAAGALAFWPRARWNRLLVLIGAAMIYSGYALTYSARIIMLKEGRWTERQFLYQYASRYHVLPLLGLVTMVAALLASWPLIRRCDARRVLPAVVATLVGLVTMFVQSGEASRWKWMLRQPDQRVTLAAAYHLGELAQAEGVPRSQLMRIFDPVYRPWNGSVMHDCPYAFHLMNLAVQAPQQVERPLPDHKARARLLVWLTPAERIALGAETCASLASSQLDPDARTISIARRLACHGVSEFKPGQYQPEHWPAYIEFEFSPTPQARYVVLPGLAADQDLVILLQDSNGRWRSGQSIRWLKSPRTDAAIDLERLIHWSGSPLSRIRVQFTTPGELALEGPPRLLR